MWVGGGGELNACLSLSFTHTHSLPHSLTLAIALDVACTLVHSLSFHSSARHTLSVCSSQNIADEFR